MKARDMRSAPLTGVDMKAFSKAMERLSAASRIAGPLKLPKRKTLREIFAASVGFRL